MILLEFQSPNLHAGLLKHRDSALGSTPNGAFAFDSACFTTPWSPATLKRSEATSSETTLSSGRVISIPLLFNLSSAQPRAAWLFGMTRGAPRDSTVAVMYLTAMVSMVLQLARFSSALLSYLAAIVAVAILIGGIVLTTEFVRPWLTSLGGDATLTVVGAILAGLFGVGIYLSARFELRLAVRRVIVGVFLLLAALEGMVLVIVWLIPDMPRGITAPKMVVIPILFIIVAAVALRLTANQRRILALSGR